ncbi:putative PEP-binding protein [Vibrio sp. SCSIO 43136]|uniref:putative PEP-binding protein n=1 Tax=Vibrio sp. SCSIO 43136 TaxID=2819101 RepID=UPI0020759234|nr:putative PEP-binding protein [Vibrio sp. SCSIO 43136]USD66516.1 phosphoenolpyruvate synthase [Vibrio sp. SCSIO 43136]
MMNVSQQGSTDKALKRGAVLPTYSDYSNDELPLMVSLSALIQEVVFYHPQLLDSEITLGDEDQQALDSVVGQSELRGHFVSTLVSNIEQTAAQGQTIQVRLTDACGDELSTLIAGSEFPTATSNPFMGARGVAKYALAEYKSAFSAECEVIKQLIVAGHCVEIVVPFVRSLSDAAQVIDLLAEHGLPRGLNGLKVHYSCDVPSAALLSDRLLQYFDGVVIHADHLAQYALGLDSLDEQVHHRFDPENDGVIELIKLIYKKTQGSKKPVSVVVGTLEKRIKLVDIAAEKESNTYVTM